MFGLSFSLQVIADHNALEKLEVTIVVHPNRSWEVFLLAFRSTSQFSNALFFGELT